MEQPTREIYASDNRFYLDEANIMYITIGDVNNEKIALEMQDAFFKLLGMADGKVVDIFADNSKSNKPSPEARKMFKEMSEHEQCGKVAVLSMNPVVRIIASFVLGLSRNKDTRIFKTKDEALVWLRGGENSNDG